MSWSTPKTWTVGSPGTSSDLNTYVRDNTNFLNQTLRAAHGGTANWSGGEFLQFGTAAQNGGSSVTYPVAYSSWAEVICVATSNAAALIAATSVTTTGFTIGAWNIATGTGLPTVAVTTALSVAWMSIGV